MITTFLRLDLYKFSNKKFSCPEKVDEINLELNEDIYNVLQGFDDVNYGELCLVTNLDSVSEESLAACFRKVKIKGKSYQWIICEEKKF